MIAEALAKLGLHGKDVVTSFEGMVASVTFDAYGCVQVLLTPGIKDGKPQDSFWYDIKRIEFGKRIMKAPNFDLIGYGKERGSNDLNSAKKA